MPVKKVLMIGWQYPPHDIGGLGVACQGLAHALVDNDVEVYFVLPHTVPLEEKKIKMHFADKQLLFGKNSAVLRALARQLQNPYISHIEYERTLKEFIKNGGKLVARNLFDQVEHYGDLIKDLFEEEDFSDVDIIHAHDWLCYGAGIEAKKILHKPLVVHVHATEFDRGGGMTVNQRVYDKEREGMHAADHVIAVSELTRKIVIDKYGVDPTKVSVVHNGNTVMPKSPHFRFKYLFDIRRDKKIVLYAGRITIQKGVDYFIQAAKKVLDYERNVMFVVAGSGDMEGQMKHLAYSLGINDFFIFTGHYEVKEQKDLFSCADVVVMPSVSEPFGIIPLESMSNGTPVIMSKQSGVSEVVTHALKVDFWDTEEIANKILAILRHPVLKETLRHEGLRQVKNITWDKAAKKTVSIYNKVRK